MKNRNKKGDIRWTIKEVKNGTTWWMIRGGAFSNVVNNKYQHRLWDEIEDVQVYCNNLNRNNDRKCEVVEVSHEYSKAY
tara:strand:- start:267 stop:503 length:237 start_codon:yes stop_codon:yes gene_type:complete